MKDQLTRIKQLFNYNFDGTFITEEMQVSDDFKNNKFYIEKEIKSVTLEVGYDPENTMEKPNIFFMETYEDYTEEKQLLPYNSIIDIILQNGYVMESKGLSHDKKKYHWKFVQKTKQQLKESKESDELYKNFKKDDKYWERRKELTMEAVRRCLLQKEKEKNNKTII